VVPDFWANMDDEVAAIMAIVRLALEGVGVTFVDVDDTEIMALNNAVGFPVVFHEAYPDMVDYLATQGPGISIEEVRAGIASPDVAGIYDTFVLPRKALDGAATSSIRRPSTTTPRTSAARPARALQGPLRPSPAGRLRLSHHPHRGAPGAPDVSEPQNFSLLIQNTEPSASAGLPGIQLPVGMGPPPACRWAWSWMATPATTAACWPSALPWKTCSGGLPPPVCNPRQESDP
jgi:mandelamide amidase